jgi:alkanesulfonate monooxygenase SsuD/methylene tetrahydromethanopterin reductase-like flavin-dependent oxidoreductase (luciferase family)
MVPRKGWGGVFWNNHATFTKQRWDRFAEVYEETHGRALEPGEKRALVLSVRVEDTHEAAIESVRDGHDEFWKFLGPYGWSRGYMGPDGKPASPGLIPTLEESIENRTWIVGTADHVAEQLAWYRDHLGGLENLLFFPAMPGDSYAKVDEQLQRLSETVMPKLA